MRSWLLFFILLSPLAQADSATDCSMEKALLVYNSEIYQLSLLGQAVESLVLGDSLKGKVTAEEEIFLKNNPMKARKIKAQSCRAVAISYVVCGFDPREGNFSRTQDEETDAIRHFLFAANLSCHLGRENAERYTIMHEGHPPWAEASEMDIRNNYVGFAWADDYYTNCANFAGELHSAKSALEKLRDGELTILRQGTTNCRAPEAVLADLEFETPASFWQTVNEVQELVAQSAKLCR